MIMCMGTYNTYTTVFIELLRCLIIAQALWIAQVLNGNLEMSMEFIGTNYLIKVVGILKIDSAGEQVCC